MADKLPSQLEALGLTTLPVDQLQLLCWNNIYRGPSALLSLPTPAAIVRCKSADDVQSAVKFALQHKLKVCVRSGGHHWGACFAQAGSLLLDCGALQQLDLDIENKTAWVGPGTTAGALYGALVGTGLHFPGPHLSSVAFGGFVTGGGNGFGVRLFGAACDCLLAVQYIDGVTGDVRTVTAKNDPTLWWGLRGGGGFLGVVVAFQLKLSPVPAQLPCSITTYSFADQGAVVRGLLAAVSRMLIIPAAIESNIVLSTGPHGPQLMVANTAYAEGQDIEDALASYASLVPDLKPSLLGHGPMEYLAALQTVDPAYDFPDVCGYGGVLNVRPQSITTQIAQLLVEHYGKATSEKSLILLAPGYPIAADACALGYRGGWIIIGVYAMWQRSELGAVADGDAQHIAWAQQLIDKLQPFTESRYVNETMFKRGESISACFEREAFRTLQHLKTAHDPHCIFRSLDG